MIPLSTHFNTTPLYVTIPLNEHEKSQKALLNLSGGQDSSLGGWFLFQAQNYHLLCPVSVHYQHFWQQDTLYAKKHCAQFSFWFNWETVYYQSTFNSGTEKNARDWRETTNWKLTTYYHCTQVINGHNVTDRYETLFNQLLHTRLNKIKARKSIQSTLKSTKATPHYTHRRQKTAIFVQQKKRSRWFFYRNEHKLRVKTKLYGPMKYGTETIPNFPL